MNRTLKLALASLLLACSSLASAAIYHVDVDTSSIDGQGGFVGFGLNGTGAPFVNATISQFFGAHLGALDSDGTFNVLGDLSSSLKLDSHFANQLTQGVVFGKKLQFDVDFAADQDLSNLGTSFTFSILDNNFAALLGNDPDGYVVRAEFTPGTALSFTSNTAAATISPVPEPETYALIGLGLLGLGLRRKRGNLLKMA
jgi:ABC-type amino acid transport substrate-binding protein